MAIRRETGPVLCILGCFVLAAVGCESTTAPPEQILDLREWTVGNARQALTADGYFHLPPPAPLPEREPILSSERASQLVLAFVAAAVAGPLGGGDQISEIHGAPIDWGEVTLGPEPSYFAHGIYLPLEDEVPRYLEVSFGPVFLVPLFYDKEQVASLSVAAHATHLDIDSDGRLHPGGFVGVEFTLLPVPQRADTILPLTPEEAVRAAAPVVGEVVSEVPRLIQPRKPRAPQAAVWELVFARPVSVLSTDSGESIETDTLYVGSGLHGDGGPPGPNWSVGTRYYVAAADQPESDTIRYLIPGVENESGSTVVQFVPGMPAELTAVSLPAHR